MKKLKTNLQTRKITQPLAQVSKGSKKQFTSRFLLVRSRHPSTEGLKHTIRIPKLAVYRHGSQTESSGSYEINSVQSVKNCSSKLLMKRCFDKGSVKHLPWIPLNEAKIEGNSITNGKIIINFPIIVKSHFGSRGVGNHKFITVDELSKFLKNNTASHYIVEPYFSGTVEFRIHITENGPIYSLRKLLKTDTPKDKRWFRNDSNCVWITEFAQNRDQRGNFISFKTQDNDKFDRPGNWNDIIAECKKALRSVGGDVLAVDVKAQSNRDSKGRKRDQVEFYILEVNSAPSMGDITTEVYKRELPRILSNKYDNFRKV